MDRDHIKKDDLNKPSDGCRRLSLLTKADDISQDDSNEHSEGSRRRYTRRCLTIFNKIAIQGKGLDGKWTRKPLDCGGSNIFNLCLIRPPEICINLVFKHIHAASSYTICRQFVPFIYCPL